MNTLFASRTQQVNAYRDREILTADRGKLLVLTFDALVAAMTRARNAITANDRDAMSTALDKSRLLLGELLATLDRANGGPLAEQLAALYVFVLSELDKIALHPNAIRLDRNLRVIRELRDAFAEIVSPRAPTS